MTRPPPGDDVESAERIGRSYDRYGAALYRYAVMILADPSGAADAVHEVFVSLLRSRATPQAEEQYLRRAVRNECYSALRRRTRDIVTPVDAPLLEAVAAHDDRPDTRLALEHLLRELPAEQREAVHLKVFEGMTFQEIAATTGESINTIASRYRYAIDKLRGRMGARR